MTKMPWAFTTNDDDAVSVDNSLRGCHERWQLITKMPWALTTHGEDAMSVDNSWPVLHKQQSLSNNSLCLTTFCINCNTNFCYPIKERVACVQYSYISKRGEGKKGGCGRAGGRRERVRKGGRGRGRREVNRSSFKNLNWCSIVCPT